MIWLEGFPNSPTNKSTKTDLDGILKGNRHFATAMVVMIAVLAVEPLLAIAVQRGDSA